jgi:hypothetical protein
MFRDLVPFLNEIENTAESTSEFLYKLNGARRRLRNIIEGNTKQAKLLLDERKYGAEFRRRLLRTAKKDCRIYIENNLLDALKTNFEFNQPIYRKLLYSMINDDDSYKIFLRGSGLNIAVTFNIDFNATGGHLNMWADAIKKTRASLGVKIPRKGSKRYRSAAKGASKAWENIWYNEHGIFLDTIRKRLESSPKPAPFWQLLDQGVVPMKSDRGGYPTPSGEHTGFVGESERSAKNFLTDKIKKEKERYAAMVSEYNSFIETEIERLYRMDALADKIRFDLRNSQNLAKDLNLEVSKIDRNKFQRAIQAIKEGIRTSGRIDITPHGAGKRRSLSVKTVLELL